MPSHDLAISLVLADNASFSPKSFEDLFTSRDTTTAAVVTTAQRVIAHGAEETIPFGDIATAKLVFVRSSRQVRLKITNAAGSGQTLVCGSSAAVAGVACFLTEATALSVENLSGASASVTVALGGS